MRPRARTHLGPALGVWLAVAVAACGGGEGGTAEGASGSDRAPAPEPVFTEAVEADDCAVLTPADVSAATGTPEADVEGRSLGGSGCYYEAGVFNINLLSVRVYESLDRARGYFERFTEDATAAEVGEAKDEVQEELARKRTEGEMSGSEAAIADALVETMPEEDVRHERWTDIGSEAAMDRRGSVRIRYGNAVVWLTGKTDGEDVLDPDLARDLAQRIVANLDEMK